MKVVICFETSAAVYTGEWITQLHRCEGFKTTFVLAT